MLLIVLTVLIGCQDSSEPNAKITTPVAEKTVLTDEVVEASCGQCQFGADGSGCDLAIRREGKIYWVDGTGIDDHGDAHGDDGLCNCIRKAVVSGSIEGDRIKATSFKLESSD